MTMLYLCTRKIEHAPACNRRSTSFESEGAVARCYSENEKEASTPATPLQSHNPDETLEGENRGRNETAKDSPSFFDRLTYTKMELYLFSKEIRRIHADL